MLTRESPRLAHLLIPADHRRLNTDQLLTPTSGASVSEPILKAIEMAISVDRSQLYNALLQALPHGDADHRQWLTEAVSAIFQGTEPPPPYGKGTSDALRAENDRLRKVVQLFADFAHADECPADPEYGLEDAECECGVGIAKAALSAPRDEKKAGEE